MAGITRVLHATAFAFRIYRDGKLSGFVVGPFAIMWRGRLVSHG
jgi:hypothetical protein